MRRFLLLVMAAVMFTAPGMCAGVNLLTNSSFEEGTFAGNAVGYETLNSGSTAITGWTVSGGSIDWISTYWTPENGRFSLDLSGNNPGSISQTVTNLDLNTTYKLTFSLAGNPDSPTMSSTKATVLTGNVLFGSASNDFSFNVSSTSRANMGWTTVSYLFTPSATTQTLTFASTSGSAFGPAIDNVSLTAVPEPTLPVLFGTLLVIVPLARRYMKK